MRVLRALRVYRMPFCWRREVSWFARKTKGKSLLARMRRTALTASVYYIWMARNCSIFQQKHVNSEMIFQQVREIMIMKYMGEASKDDGSGANLLRSWY